MSTFLSLPEELVIEVLLKGDHRMLLTCQRVCRMFNVIIKDSLALQYIISLAACGMQDDLSMTLCRGTAERLQRLGEHEAAWREIAWSDGGVITHAAACDFPVTISGSVLAFLKQCDGDPGNSEVGDRLFLLRVPSKLRGIPGESWELKGLGEMSNLCIDAAQDLLLFQRAGNLHVRSLSSGEVHPATLHSGAFDMGMDTSDVAETPVVCCDHLAAVVYKRALSQTTLVIKRTVNIWNWRVGNQVVVLRPLFARLGREIAFLNETHLLIPASAACSTLEPGPNYDIMLLVYKFEKSSQQIVAPIPYCFHVVLPVRTGLATIRQVRISTNTASFSPPVDSRSTSGSNSSRGYFYADPKDRIIALEVSDKNCLQSKEETAELYVPSRTFLAYIAAHPLAAAAEAESASPRFVSGTSVPVVNVPWEEWGPYGAHLVRPEDQAYIIRRPRACGMRVLGSALSKESVVVVDYHPGRVARSATAAIDAGSVSVSMGGGGTFSDSAVAARAASVRAEAPIPAPAPAQLPVGVSTFSSERRFATGTTTITRIPRCFPRLVCATKEVPLPPELRNTYESPWTMLCEDALLAFEYVPDGFEISRVFAYTF